VGGLWGIVISRTLDESLIYFLSRKWWIGGAGSYVGGLGALLSLFLLRSCELEEPDRVREDIGGISFYFQGCELGGIGSIVAGLGDSFISSLNLRN
jgi:hypothetical protein